MNFISTLQKIKVGYDMAQSVQWDQFRVTALISQFCFSII